ncbi:MAG: TPM domain-containing protein [Elainellaceae cyanobacterium]
MLQMLLGQRLSTRFLASPLSGSRMSKLWRFRKRSPLKQVALAALGLLLVFCSVVLQSVAADAVFMGDVSDPRITGGWVTDKVGILNDSVKAEINTRITDLESTDGAEIAVVVVRDTQSAATPRDYALEMFNAWGLGKVAQNNGVLMLISTGDRRVEIITGDGLGQRLPDAQVQNIVDRVIIPRFKQEDYGGGALQGTVALIDALTGAAPSSATRSKPFSLLPEASTQTTQESTRWPALMALIENVGLYVAGAFAIAASAYLGAVRLSRRRIFVTIDDRPHHSFKTRWLTHGLLALAALAVTFNLGLFIFAAIAFITTPLLIIPAFLALAIALCVINPDMNMRAHAEKYGLPVAIVSIGALILQGVILSLLITVIVGGLAAAYALDLILLPSAVTSGEWAILGAVVLSLFSSIHLSQWVGSQFLRDSNNKPILPNLHCDRCRHPLTLIHDESLQALLTEPEKTAQSLGSAKFQGLQCTFCSDSLSREHAYVLRRVLNRYKYRHCPTCEELTMSHSTEVVTSATYSSSGSRRVTQDCLCCGKHEEELVTIPRKTRSSSSSRSSRSSSSSSGGGHSSGGGGGGSW